MRRSILALFSVQAANYVVPLLVLPYLVRVLGVDKYGQLAFVLAAVQYVVLFSEYGFNLSATRSVAAQKDNPDSLSEIFWSTMFARIFLGGVGLLVLGILVGVVPYFREDWTLFLAASTAVLGSVLLPQWWYQGMERIELFAGMQLLSRIVCAVLMFVLVNNDGDLVLAVLLQSAPPLVGAIIALSVMSICLPVRFKLVHPKQVVKTLRGGLSLFFATSSVSLYTTSNVFVLGLVSTNAAVAYFSLAEKVVRAAAGLITPVAQAGYPRINSLIGRDRVQASRLARRLGVLMVLIGSVCSLVLFFAADLVVRLVGGVDAGGAVPVLRILAALPVLLAFNTYWGTLVMAPAGLDSRLGQILLIAGVVNVAMLVPLSLVYASEGAAVSVAITELLVAGAMKMVLLHRERATSRSLQNVKLGSEKG